MTSDERLDQIEPVLADVVRTQGRIIFQIGKIVDYVTDTREQVAVVIQRLNRLEIKVDLLEERTSQIAEDVAVLKTDVAELKTDVAELKTDVAELKTDVAELKIDVASLKEGQIRIETRQNEMQQDVKAIFKLLQERLN
jgi:chromosome segregation ATPase